MNALKDLKDVSKTQVLATGMNLKDLLKDDFIGNIQSKFGKEFEDIVVSDIRLMLIPKPITPELKEDDKGIVIQLQSPPFIRFEQPSPEHYKEKVVVITSNTKGILDKVLK